MKARELAEKLMLNPDFDVQFSFCEKDLSEYGLTLRNFYNIVIDDIGYSSKVIILGGDE